MSLDRLQQDLITDQKKGLPFIITSVIIWGMIALVNALNLNITLTNILVFCCAAPLLPIAWFIGKKIQVDIFANDNELGKAGLFFTMNQLLYLLIVIWVFNAVPEKMVMVFAMVFGAHLLPYAWLYNSKGYLVAAIIIPIISLFLGSIGNGFIVAMALVVIEILLVVVLWNEVKLSIKS